MLHIATVHYREPRWVEVQTRHLERFITSPYETWTSLEGIDDRYGNRFDHVLEQKGKHGEKLNHLALEISNVAAPDDLLMFLDGDAFPIADLTPLLESDLSETPLVAIRRAENLGDPQPHPSFTLTTVGFWRQLPGDWSCGYTWVNDNGQDVTDIGANLLRALELAGIPWRELRRSAQPDIHPLWYGVYGDVIYHHGAGFRSDFKYSRLDTTTQPKILATGPVPGISQLMHRVNNRRMRRWREGTETANRAESERVFAMIERGDADWLSSLTAPTHAPTTAG